METAIFETWINLEGVETDRTYYFNNGFVYTIVKPVKLFVKRSGSHKLVDNEGVLHYIRSSWTVFKAHGEWKFNVK